MAQDRTDLTATNATAQSKGLDSSRTVHPCHGMTKAQREAFELIAINQHPRCKWPTIDALLKAGVIERGESEKRRDAIGTYEIPHFFVPLPIHMQWCEWCSEQPGIEP